MFRHNGIGTKLKMALIRETKQCRVMCAYHGEEALERGIDLLSIVRPDPDGGGLGQ